MHPWLIMIASLILVFDGMGLGFLVACFHPAQRGLPIPRLPFTLSCLLFAQLIAAASRGMLLEVS